MLNLNILLELCLQTSVLFILLCFLHLFWCVFSINNNNNRHAIYKCGVNILAAALSAYFILYYNIPVL